MASPAIEIKDFLVTNTVGVFGATTGWGIYVGSQPEDPDSVITLTDSPGETANPKFSLDFPRWTVRVRGNPNDYTSAYDKSKEIKDVLQGLLPQSLSGTFYDGIFIVGDIFFLQSDRKGRPEFISNWRGILEPPASGNRIAL